MPGGSEDACALEEPELAIGGVAPFGELDITKNMPLIMAAASPKMPPIIVAIIVVFIASDCRPHQDCESDVELLFISPLQ